MEITIVDKDKKGHHNLLKLAYQAMTDLGFERTSNEGELLAFAGFARAFPNNFLVLVDTYDMLGSGIPNFLSLALALHRLGYKPVGVRLDSGDLAYLSKEARNQFKKAAEKTKIDYFSKFMIVASNDINENILLALNEQGNEIDAFGIGTNLVTCQSQPALGAVYKLVQVNGLPRIKLSQDVEKVTLPGRKEAYRLYVGDNVPVIDILQIVGNPIPQVNTKILCRHPFIESKRAYVSPLKVEALHHLVWDEGHITIQIPTIFEVKEYAKQQLQMLRKDHLRLLNPTPYKVSVNEKLYDYVHTLWLQEAPIKQLL